jgi:hypothetical protein
MAAQSSLPSLALSRTRLPDSQARLPHLHFDPLHHSVAKANELSTPLMPMPLASSPRVLSIALGSFKGLPSVLPLATARLRPAAMRAWSILRSSSAKAPHIWSMSLPAGVVVSIACWSRYRSTPQAFQAFDRAEQIDQRSAETIDCPSHHHIEPPALRLLQHVIKPWPIFSPLGSADPSIIKCLDDLPTPRLGDLSQRCDLVLDGLPISANPHI